MSIQKNTVFPVLCRVFYAICVIVWGGKEEGVMDTKKIGEFLKKLRKEKGLTQEQLAEILFVSGRTISRWETGTNMPDLGILIRIAEFYHVEVKEILDGERKNGMMEKEMKETLEKVADYNRMEKEKAARAGNIAFSVTFLVCAAAIVIQLIVTGTLPAVLGETVTLLAGGAGYIGLMLHDGVWESHSGSGNILLRDILVSTACSAVFTVLLVILYRRLGAETGQTAHMAILFSIGTAAIGFAVLRILAYCDRKRKDRNRADHITCADNAAGK